MDAVENRIVRACLRCRETTTHDQVGVPYVGWGGLTWRNYKCAVCGAAKTLREGQQ